MSGHENPRSILGLMTLSRHHSKCVKYLHDQRPSKSGCFFSWAKAVGAAYLRKGADVPGSRADVRSSPAMSAFDPESHDEYFQRGYTESSNLRRRKRTRRPDPNCRNSQPIGGACGVSSYTCEGGSEGHGSQRLCR